MRSRIKASRATGPAHAVYMVLMIRSSDRPPYANPVSWPSVHTISDDAKVSQATVHRALRKLESLGQVKCHHDGNAYRMISVVAGDKTPRRGHVPTVYELLPLAGRQTATPSQKNNGGVSHCDPGGVSERHPKKAPVGKSPEGKRLKKTQESRGVIQTPHKRRQKLPGISPSVLRSSQEQSTVGSHSDTPRHWRDDPKYKPMHGWAIWDFALLTKQEADMQLPHYQLMNEEEND